MELFLGGTDGQTPQWLANFSFEGISQTMYSRTSSKGKAKEKLLRYYSHWAHRNFHSYGEVLRGSVHWAPSNCCRAVPLQIVRAQFRSYHSLGGIHLKNPGREKKWLLIINSCTHLSRDEDVGGRNCSLPASKKRKYRTNSSWFCSLTLERGRKRFSPSSLLRTHSQIHCWMAEVHHMENTEEKQNLLEERWTEVITETEYLCVCTSALNRWQNALK